jgi:dienelactone hydrolase
MEHEEYFLAVARYKKYPHDPVDLKITPCPASPNIIINYPGFKGHIDGYNNKHFKLAQLMAGRGLGGVLQMGNIYRENRDYKLSVINDLRAVVEYAIDNAPRICGVKRADLFLIGTSAGGGAVAAVAGEYKEVKKILLMAPSKDAAQTTVKKNFAKFKGEVYIVIGDKDDVVGPLAGKIYYDLAKKASRRELIVIPDCDHQFTGTVNGQIMGNAPFWAFANDKPTLSPEGGPILY